MASCAERPPSAINPDNIPPTVTIISPAEVDVSNISAKTLKNKPDENTSETEIEKRGVDLKSLKETAGKQVINEKYDTETTSKKAGTYKKGVELIFEGHAVDVEGNSISESSLRWTSDKEGEIGRGYSFTKSDLSAGEHQIVLFATDSEGGVGRDTVYVTIEAQTEILGNKLPVVKILSLEEGWSLLNTTELILRGVAEDSEDGKLEGELLVWKSSKDGVLGTGSPLNVTGKLSLGDHTITLMATDSDGNTGEVSVDISITDKIDDTINNSPVANILSIADEASLDGVLKILSNTKLILEGTAEDVEDGTLGNGSLEWSSDVDGVLGTGSSLDITGQLSLGEHVITLTATDKKGAEGYDNATIQINNVPPVADILSLEEGMSLLETEDLILEGTGKDFEDGIRGGESLVWTSDINGKLGIGGNLNATGLLSTGYHTITLTAIDSEGATGSDKVTISVNLAPPMDLTAEVLNSTTVRLRWQDNSNNETHFNIEMRAGDFFVSAGTAGENATSFDVTDLQAESLYEFRVSAENNDGISDYSNFVEAITLPAQIISTVTADNTVDSSQPEAPINGGTLKLLNSTELKTENRIALQFSDLQDLILGRPISKATLQLTEASILDVSLDLEMAINRFTNSWDPDSLNWNKHLEKIWAEDLLSYNIRINAGKTTELDITSIVEAWASKEWANHGLLLKSNSELLNVEFESMNTEGQAPQIIVDFAD